MKIDYLSLLLLLIIAGAIGYAVFSNDGLLVSREVVSDVLNDMAGAVGSREAKPLPVLGKAPDVTGIVDWINTEPLRSEDLRGKVVLIDFWTYSCINCIRTFPYIRSWHEKYADTGFVLLGVHTPEFNFERKRANVVQAAQENGLTYPIAMDNDYATWDAFENRYWPAHYLLDVDGNIRFQHFGEGKYAETERAIQSLLREGGLLDAEQAGEISEDASGERGRVLTPETYLGYRRIDHFGGPNDVQGDVPYDFPAPQTIARNTFYLAGRWTISAEAAELVGEQGSIIYNYFASQANLVMEPGETGAVTVEVTLDGQPLTDADKGTDVFLQDGRSLVRVDSSRLYSLVDTGTGDWRTLELTVTAPGLKAFAFTFG